MNGTIPGLWIQIVLAFPEPVLAPRTVKLRGRLRLSPAQVLQAIQAYAVATWSLEMVHRFHSRFISESSNALTLALTLYCWGTKNCPGPNIFTAWESM